MTIQKGNYFNNPSNLVQENGIYPIWAGQYCVNQPYLVHKKYMNAYYVNYIIKGQMYFELKGKRYVAHAGQMVLLDCRQEHEYGALKQSCTFIYIHFRSSFLTPITTNLQKIGLVFNSRGQELTLFERIMKLIKNNRLFINDEKLSLLLFQLINDLVFSQKSFLSSEKLSPEVIQAEDYIEQNCSHKLTLQEVSS